jgi:hypothetical protein
MILRPDPPEDEELEDDRYSQVYPDIYPSINKPQTYMGSFTPDISLPLKALL